MCVILYIIRTNAIFDLRLKTRARIIYEVWLLNNQIDLLKRFIRYQLHWGLFIVFSVFPSAISYTAPVEFSAVHNSAGRALMLRTSVLFAFILSNLVPLSFAIRFWEMSRFCNGRVRQMFRNCYIIHCEERLHRQNGMDRHIVPMKHL